MNLNMKLQEIKGIGIKTQEALEKKGIHNLRDLLYYFPRTYEDYQARVKIIDIKPGRVIIKGKIRNLRNIHTRRKNFTITQGEVYDETGAVRVVWYNQPYRLKNFTEEKIYYFTGDYDFKYNRYQLTSPTATLASEVDQKIEGYQPIYSTKGSLTSAWFKKLFEKIRSDFVFIPDLLPMEQAPAFLSPAKRAEALYNIHFPRTIQDVYQARQYLGYEELFELLLASELNRKEAEKLRSYPLPFSLKQTKLLLKSLPFQLTQAQKRSAWEILQDLQRDTPMNRLLQGDVGSGKTVVSALAIHQAALSKTQAALLAPTAILASQHAENLQKILAPFGVRICLLTSSTKNKDLLKEQIKKGEIDLIIGTHAILTDDTAFHSLSLCIIDEQHRFGVAQRQKLLEKVSLNVKSSSIHLSPHFLAMTATPIPRSLQLTIFGDLDISVINQMPKGRKKIQTKILNEINMKEQLYPKLQEHLSRGEQVYWICRLIDDSEFDTPNMTDQKTVKKEVEKLQRIFPKFRIHMLHGKMRPQEKDLIMQKFKDHEIDILVSTTVIEVGVDVQNATQMVVLNAEHYGLAQLHQLRGRVGRGKLESQCFLITTGDNPPSQRLRELEKSTDGFYLAEVDLKLRGPGEIYGVLQHGELNLNIANLADTKMIMLAKKQVESFVKHPKNMLKYEELNQIIHKYQQLTTLN